MLANITMRCTGQQFRCAPLPPLSSIVKSERQLSSESGHSAKPFELLLTAKSGRSISKLPIIGL